MPMRAVIQRVTSASVTIDGSVQGHIGQGFLILFGAGQGDTPEDAVLLARKTAGLRLFCDGDGKMNLSLKDVGGSVLVVLRAPLCRTRRKHCMNILSRCCGRNIRLRTYRPGGSGQI